MSAVDIRVLGIKGSHSLIRFRRSLAHLRDMIASEESIACSDQDSGVTPDRSEILWVSPRELSKAEAAFLESSGFTGCLERRRPPAGVLCLR